MVEYICSRLSAHHNYWINGAATPGFVVGNPNSPGAFYFLADLVLPGEKTPRIHARLFDEKGCMLTEIAWNRIGKNPGGGLYELVDGGFRISKPDGVLMVEICTREFTNGFTTHIRGNLYDAEGSVRMKTEKGECRIVGEEACMTLEAPFEVP